MAVSRRRALDLRRNQHRTRTPRLNARDDAPYIATDPARPPIGERTVAEPLPRCTREWSVPSHPHRTPPGPVADNDAEHRGRGSAYRRSIAVRAAGDGTTACYREQSGRPEFEVPCSTPVFSDCRTVAGTTAPGDGRTVVDGAHHGMSFPGRRSCGTRRRACPERRSPWHESSRLLGSRKCGFAGIKVRGPEASGVCRPTVATTGAIASVLLRPGQGVPDARTRRHAGARLHAVRGGAVVLPVPRVAGRRSGEGRAAGWRAGPANRSVGEVAQYFQNYNGNKRSVVVDVATQSPGASSCAGWLPGSTCSSRTKAQE